jgi:hypothetical protein
MSGIPVPRVKGMSSMTRLIHEVHRRSLWQVVSIYLVGSWISYQVILGLTDGLGLPAWVPPLAFVLFLIGSPIIVATVAETLRVSEQRTASLRDFIRNPQPYADSLAMLFGSAYGFRLSQINTAPYEALKARGLQLVSDDALRVAIIRVYETGAAEIRRADDIITNVSFDVMRPYYLAHFRDLQFLEHATPLDYATVASDPYFHNLLDYRLTVLRRGVLSRYEATVVDMAHLIDAIDRELDRRE